MNKIYAIKGSMVDAFEFNSKDNTKKWPAWAQLALTLDRNEEGAIFRDSSGMKLCCLKDTDAPRTYDNTCVVPLRDGDVITRDCVGRIAKYDPREIL